MAIAHELTIARQSFNRRTLPDGLVTVDVFQRSAIQDEIAPIDPSVGAFWLFVEFGHLIAVECDSAEAGRGAHGSYGDQFPVRIVESEKGGYIQIGDAVAISQHERVFV